METDRYQNTECPLPVELRITLKGSIVQSFRVEDYRKITCFHLISLRVAGRIESRYKFIRFGSWLHVTTNIKM